MSHYSLGDWLVILLVLSIPYIIIFHSVLHTKKAMTGAVKNTEMEEHIDNVADLTAFKEKPISYVETPNAIYRTDNQPISDEEVPYLIEITKQSALEQYQQSPNPKPHRTDREENLVAEFMLKHDDEIQQHTDSFETQRRLAYEECDLDKKIEMLQKTISLYESEKKWFYRTKGGKLYFQDFYEHLHNSRSCDFDYISGVREYLNDCIRKRDYIIPELIHLITNSNGILQKNVYKYLPDVPMTVIQETIRELEDASIITRTKKSNSYFLTI